MNRSFSVVFVSNYINHHQIPFCNALTKILQGSFTFLQTEPMEEERVRMGWHEEERPSYVKCFYEEEALCRRLIEDCDILLFGGTDDESYIQDRLKAGRPIIRISERLYKTGQWKAVSPRGLRKKYHDHTRYRKAQVYLLCAGAYVASDFRIIRAYPGKMYCWGYFPEARHYDPERLMAGKGYVPEEADRIPRLLWAGRMIDWKHPELAVETAGYLREKGIGFHMDIIGDGELRPETERLAESYGLKDRVSFLGYQSPEAVRDYMEKADIFLFTSDRQEGWGAVANEAMNSGCALVAGHRIGAAPYLIRNGENGFLYEDGRKEQLFALTKRLAEDRELCREMGRKARETIEKTWNAEKAAGELAGLMEKILQNKDRKIVFENAGEREDSAGGSIQENPTGTLYSPCAPAPVLWERRAGRQVRKKWKQWEKENGGRRETGGAAYGEKRRGRGNYTG